MAELTDILKKNADGSIDMSAVTDEHLNALAAYYSARIRLPGEVGQTASKELLGLFRNSWPKEFYQRFQNFVLDSVRENENPLWRQQRELIEKMGVV